MICDQYSGSGHILVVANHATESDNYRIHNNKADIIYTIIEGVLTPQ